MPVSAIAPCPESWCRLAPVAAQRITGFLAALALLLALADGAAPVRAQPAAPGRRQAPAAARQRRPAPAAPVTGAQPPRAAPGTARPPTPKPSHAGVVRCQPRRLAGAGRARSAEAATANAGGRIVLRARAHRHRRQPHARCGDPPLRAAQARRRARRRGPGDRAAALSPDGHGLVRRRAPALAEGQRARPRRARDRGRRAQHARRSRA